MNSSFNLLGHRLTLTGPTSGEDALWLAASIPQLPAHTRVLDVGTGIGTAALALLVHQPHLHITGIDTDPALIAHAQTNAKSNALNLTVLTADAVTYKEAPFPLILSNPPFHAQSRGHATPNPHKSQAHSMPENLLTTWLLAFHNLLTPNGAIHLILHSQCEEELLAFTRNNAYAVTLTPLQTSPKNPPKRMLVKLQKSQSFAVTKNPPLPTYEESLREKILKNAEALST